MDHEPRVDRLPDSAVSDFRIEAEGIKGVGGVHPEGQHVDVFGRALSTLTTQHRQFLKFAEGTVVQLLRDDVRRLTAENSSLHAHAGSSTVARFQGDTAQISVCSSCEDFGDMSSSFALPSVAAVPRGPTTRQQPRATTSKVLACRSFSSDDGSRKGSAHYAGDGGVSQRCRSPSSQRRARMTFGRLGGDSAVGVTSLHVRGVSQLSRFSAVEEASTKSADALPALKATAWAEPPNADAPEMPKVAAKLDHLSPSSRASPSESFHYSSSSVSAKSTKRAPRRVQKRPSQQWAMGHPERSVLLNLVMDPRTECLAFFIIIANSILIAVRADVESRSGTGAHEAVFWSLEVGFCALFLIEVWARMAADWTSYFHGPGKVLNVWDLVLLIAQCAEVIYSLGTAGSADNPNNFSYLRILRIARAIRVFQAVKVLAYFEQVRMCIMAVMVSIKPFAASIMLFFLLIICWAVYFTDLATSKKKLLAQQGDAEGAEALQFYFGHVFASGATLWQAITGGVDWHVPAATLPSTSDRVLFYFFVAFSMVCMMNVVTAILVQQVAAGLEEDKMHCLLPQLVGLLKAISPEPDSFKEGILACLSRAPFMVTVSGLEGEAEVANGPYEPSASYGQRPLLRQIGRDEGDDVYMYFKNRAWNIGLSTEHRWVSRVSLMDVPPQGKYFPSSPEIGTAIVQVSVYKEQQELVNSLSSLGIREVDVEDIFRLCETSGAPDVDLPTFTSIVKQSRLPARRLEQMVTNAAVEEIRENENRWATGRLSQEHAAWD